MKKKASMEPFFHYAVNGCWNTCRTNERGASPLEITSGAIRVHSVLSQLFLADLKWAGAAAGGGGGGGGGGDGCVTQLPSLSLLNHRNCDNVRQIHATSPGSGVGAYIRRLG